MVDFTSILDKPVDQIEKPKPRPIGTYLGTVVGMPKQVTRVVQGEEVPILSFSVKLVQAQEDVDQEDLQAHGDLSTWPPMQREFWLNSPEAEWALRQFLTNTLDIEPGPPGKAKKLGQMVAEAPGKQLIVTLKHRPFTNKQGEAEIATDIGGTAKA